MAERIEVSTVDDPRLEVFLGLRDQSTRQRLERPGAKHSGTFIAEGDLVIERGLAKGHSLRSVLISAKRTKPLPELPATTHILLANDDVLTEVTGRPELRDPLACFERPPLPSAQELVGASTVVALLVGLNNPNNLGVIMRNAAGLGVDAILLDPTCGDPLYRRAIRSSMGQVFSVPHARTDSADVAVRVLHEAGFETVALTPSGDRELRDHPQPERVAILLGAEGPGLPEETMAAATHRVRISMGNDVDSLNVANAAAIAFHHYGNVGSERP